MSMLYPYITPFLAVSALLYIVLAVRVSRSGPHDSLVSIFLLLVGGMLAGSAFSFGATEANLFSIGRTLGFFSAGFIPVIFYTIYREYTGTGSAVGDRHAVRYSNSDDGSRINKLTTQYGLGNDRHAVRRNV